MLNFGHHSLGGGFALQQPLRDQQVRDPRAYRKTGRFLFSNELTDLRANLLQRIHVIQIYTIYTIKT